MCVMSMIMEHKHDEWMERYFKEKMAPCLPATPPWVTPQVPVPEPPPALPTEEEIKEFRRLLDRAREYDKRMNQPDCELEEKRQKLRDMAEKLGVEIEFV